MAKLVESVGMSLFQSACQSVCLPVFRGICMQWAVLACCEHMPFRSGQHLSAHHARSLDGLFLPAHIGFCRWRRSLKSRHRSEAISSAHPTTRVQGSDLPQRIWMSSRLGLP